MRTRIVSKCPFDMSSDEVKQCRKLSYGNSGNLSPHLTEARKKKHKKSRSFMLKAGDKVLAWCFYLEKRTYTYHNWYGETSTSTMPACADFYTSKPYRGKGYGLRLAKMMYKYIKDNRYARPTGGASGADDLLRLAKQNKKFAKKLTVKEIKAWMESTGRPCKHIQIYGD